MNKKHYILASILIGWVSYLIFPIEEPTVTYFLGIFIGTVSLFYIPNEKYTHNIFIQAALWTLLLFIFPEYIIAGLAVGVATHLGLDLLKNAIKGSGKSLGFYQQWLLFVLLVFANSIIVSGVAATKYLHY